MEQFSSDPAMLDLLPRLNMTPGGPAGGDERFADDTDLAADRTAVYSGIAGVEAELRRCHALLDGVAESLGACAHCLGTEPGCAYCRGTGRPGSRPAVRHDEKETTL
jgi:hypothetical protein